MPKTEVQKKKLVRFDWAMKYILRNKVNFDVLEGFLSNLLKEEIRIENLLESESNREEEDRKFNRVDLLCTDSQSRRIIVEIQNQREVDYFQRLLWGTSKAIVENLSLGAPYRDVKKVISISILYFAISQDKEYIYKGQTEFFGVHSGKPLVIYRKKPEALGTGGAVTGQQIFPEYYLIDVERFEDVVNEEIDEWVYFFKHGVIREDFKSPGILLASQKLDILAMNQEERRAYENHLAYLASERDILETSREEGRAEGRAEGRVEGIEAGKQALLMNMRKAGMEIGQIAAVTGLTVEEIEKLV